MRVTLLSLWTSTCLTAAVGLSLSSSDPNFPMQRNLTKTLAGTNAPSKILNQSGIGEDQLDFILKFKGQHVSLKTLLQKLLKSNASVTLPVNKQFFLEKVADQKNSSQQSCQGRCFIEERSDAVMSCYCDKDCKKWGDCCWDFKTRCAEIIGDSFTDSMTCGNINDHSWSGVLMKSTCELNNEYTSDCKNVEHLSLSIQRELPVFDAQNNITYRSIACARCNNADRERLIPWGLRVTCPDQRTKLPQDKNITTIKTFLKDKCSWNYEPTVNLSRIFKSCVVRDTLCHSSTQFSGLTLVKELCSSYSMLFSVKASQYVTHFYRNPHCAICNPQGKQFGKNEDGDDDEGPILPPLGPPLSVLLDISSETFIIEKKPQVTHPSILTNHSFEAKNSSVLFEGKKCFIIGSAEVNQSSTLHLNRGVVHMPSYKVGLQHVYGNFVSVLCPTDEGKPRKLEDEIYITFIGSILSIISLLFLVAVYMSFKELRNLPGKCLVSLSSALVCYQINFRLSAVSKDVEGLCKAVAICLHFFFLAAFSWMSVIAFDTANTFKVQVKDPRKQARDIKKTFIKYCILGWGVPIAIVVSCVTLDYTGAVEFGYGNHSQYCGISDRIAIAVTMVTPVSLALVFNVVCLTKSVCTIYHLQKGSGQVLSSRSRVPLLLICFKLTTIMGLTWILTLVANWEQASFLQYPATVLNSLQGFIIMMCFITTKRVRSLIREKFCKRSSRAQAKQGTTPDVTTFGCHQAQFRTRCQRNSADNQEKTA